MALPYCYATDNGRFEFQLNESTGKVMTDKAPFENAKRVFPWGIDMDEYMTTDKSLAFMHECKCGVQTTDFADLVQHRDTHHGDYTSPMTVFWSAVYNSESEAIVFIKSLFEEQQKKFNRVPNTGISVCQVKGSAAWNCDSLWSGCNAFLVLRKMPDNKFGVLYSRSHSVNCAAPNGPTWLSTYGSCKSMPKPNDSPPSKRARDNGNVQSSSELSQQPPVYGQSTSRGQGNLHSFKWNDYGQGTSRDSAEWYDYDDYSTRLSATNSVSTVSSVIVAPITTPPADLPTVGTAEYFKWKADDYQGDFDDLAIRRSNAADKRDSIKRQIDDLEKSIDSVSAKKVEKRFVKQKKVVTFQMTAAESKKSADEQKAMNEKSRRLAICLDALKGDLEQLTAMIAEIDVKMVDVKEKRNRLRDEEDAMKQNL